MTALLEIHNDIAVSVNSKHLVLVLLDLIATLDTVEHSVLLTRLNHFFGISGTALK